MTKRPWLGHKELDRKINIGRSPESDEFVPAKDPIQLCSLSSLADVKQLVYERPAYNFA